MTAGSMKSEGGSVRIDRWLCAARVYKSRTQATQACVGGLVKVNDDGVKPHHALRVGDRVRAQTERGPRILEVKALAEKRLVRAARARPLRRPLTAARAAPPARALAAARPRRRPPHQARAPRPRTFPRTVIAGPARNPVPRTDGRRPRPPAAAPASDAQRRAQRGAPSEVNQFRGGDVRISSTSCCRTPAAVGSFGASARKRCRSAAAALKHSRRA